MIGPCVFYELCLLNFYNQRPPDLSSRIPFNIDMKKIKKRL